MSKSKREKKEEQLRLKRAASTVSPSQGVLAQLVRAPPCHGGGCGFEPRRLRILCFALTLKIDRIVAHGLLNLVLFVKNAPLIGCRNACLSKKGTSSPAGSHVLNVK